jgi:hypothetical protein
MKHTFTLATTWLACLFAFASEAQPVQKQFPESVRVSLNNSSPQKTGPVLIAIPLGSIRQAAASFNPKGFVVLSGATEIPSQFDEARKEVLVVLEQTEPGRKLSLQLRYHPKQNIPRTYSKRTQAELSHKVNGTWRNREYIGGKFMNVQALRVPPEHKDHSWFLRYEGPGWESDKVGYRLYLDQRNAVDVFGKTTSDMVLQQVGQDGFDSYHDMQPWGMDILKVGNSLGLGSIGAFSKGTIERVEKTDSVTCTITANGPVYSSIQTQYYGWRAGTSRADITSVISIHAGSRLTHQRLLVKGNVDTLCTGIVKDKLAKVITFAGDKNRFGYLATYGPQSLNNDNLGLVVFFNPENGIRFAEDNHSHAILLRHKNGTLEYYYAAAWEKEANGIATEEGFRKYIDEIAAMLAHPLQVTGVQK